jgi:hypothetical protein
MAVAVLALTEVQESRKDAPDWLEFFVHPKGEDISWSLR